METEKIQKKERQILEKEIEKEIEKLDNIKACLLYEVDEDEEFTDSQQMKLCSAVSFINLSIYQLRELILCDRPC